MTIKEFQKSFESILPPAIAWKNDNVGLQVGNGNDKITGVVVALDATMEIALEAKKNKANLVVTHHPLLFYPLKNVTSDSRIGELVLWFAQHNINLYAAHTNLDSVKWGVNFALATALGLKNVTILSPMKESLTKIVVFVPHDYVEKVAEAMHAAGAGTFTKYDQCSFRTEGTGTFRGMNDAKPFLGKVGMLEKAKEIRLEMLCEHWKINSVLSAMVKAHPYEEVAYDIYPLINENTEYGLGAIGNLPKKMNEKEFLGLVQKTLGTPMLRFSPSSRTVQRIAVCGGSGSEFIANALHQHADAMITADLRYHTFQAYEHQLLLIDAGHYETERFVLPVLAEKIKEILKQQTTSIKVFITKHSTNPVKYYRSN